MQEQSQNNGSKWVILFILMLIWGSSFILMKRGLESYTPIQLGATRIVITFICLLPLAISRLRKIKREHLWPILIVGLLGNGFPIFLFAKAQTVLDSQIAGILNSVSPLFTLIVGALFFRFKSKWHNVLGVIIGFTGVVGLLWASNEKEFSLNFGYGMLIILSTLFYAININVIKRYLKDVDAMTMTAVAFLFIGIPAGAALFSTDFGTRLTSGIPALIDFAYIAILAILGTAIAQVLYNHLIKISSILFAASVTYLSPVIAIMWGFLDGEPFKISYILWILFIFTGVFLVNHKTG